MKFTLGFILGASVGAAVVHYLNTSEGKALVNKVKADAEEVSENLTGLADDLAAKTKSLIGKGDEQSVETGETILILDLNT